MAELLEGPDGCNLYVVKVRNIEDILHLSGADMLYLCFSGCFLPGAIAVFSITWINDGYKTGLTRFLVARGYARYQIVLSNFVSAAAGIVGIILAYLITSGAGGMVLGEAGKLDVGRLLLFLAAQTGILVVFGFLCMAVTYAVENEIVSMIGMISLIIALPDLLRYMKIFTNGAGDLEGLWLLNYSTKLALRENLSMGWCALLSMAVMGVSVLISISAFTGKEIR